MNIIENIKNYVLENLSEDEKNELTIDILNGYDFSDDLDTLIYCIIERMNNTGDVLVERVVDLDKNEIEEFYGTFQNFKKYYIDHMDYYTNELEFYEYEELLEDFGIIELNKYIERFWYKLFNFIYKQTIEKYEFEIGSQIVYYYNYIREECF